MADATEATKPIEDWPLRPAILAGLLAAAGLVIYFLVEYHEPEPLAGGAAAFIFFGSIAAAFTIGPQRLKEPALFALGIGLVMGGLSWHWLRVQETSAGGHFAFAAGVFATGLALPLFQAGFHHTKLATSYQLTHFHVWTDVVSAAGAMAFTGLSWLLLVLLNGLFDLVGIDVIEDLMDEEWFAWMFSGAAFGAGLGVLRNNLKIIGSLQNVVLLVLSLLAVPLALGLIVFLVALLSSGGQALWDATDAATPILLSCAVGSFVLTCAVMREDDAAMSGNRVQRIAAMVLAAGIFPLAVFAAISMGIRVDQRGLSPERIWALICIAIATAYGLAWWVGLIRGRMQGWAAELRRANLHLAVATCGLALLLALPWHDFGAVSARNQVARLEAGKILPDDFDFAALRWDFGDSGRAVLDRLASGEGEVAQLAAEARDEDLRPSPWERRGRNLDIVLRVDSEDPAVEPAIREYLRATPWFCNDYCVVLELEDEPEGARDVLVVQSYASQRLSLVPDGDGLKVEVEPAVEVAEAAPNMDADSEVEIREVTKCYVFIDGKPQGQPIDEGEPDIPHITATTSE
ncbi:DUF4153 domain-containing protein [Alteraurantiacibacter aquimixticola]|uniref:DUF4153 domain-containing protein n=1 Tax=Alteraurantiacibacter aquimixticola TaxID=2489173 RepID=A0A4T3F243_9SPHN|nr:DUF4153 domain-containing protein [Alteraurantiacibacter aquimixticola]TIX51303.1 DUF4153 domain-containing protein [Alteraurantiacibacter aquimixticola]